MQHTEGERRTQARRKQQGGYWRTSSHAHGSLVLFSSAHRTEPARARWGALREKEGVARRGGTRAALSPPK